jgi:SAM-dependent methyltransferase
MKLDEIKDHWRNWANAGLDFRATTRAATIKRLEIDALARAIRLCDSNETLTLDVLEAGCGNGQNCVALAQIFPQIRFDGFDYIEKMVDSARLLATQNNVSDRTYFTIGDMLAVSNAKIRDCYDVVFTDRAIINLNTQELQFRAIRSLCSLVRPRGLFLLLENFVETYERQNDCRERLGLQRRSPAAFNVFLNGTQTETFVREFGFELVEVDDFGSLHDLILYVLLPAVNDGRIEYGHPLVEATATLCEKLPSEDRSFGAFGQNRLFVFRKLT